MPGIVLLSRFDSITDPNNSDWRKDRMNKTIITLLFVIGVSAAGSLIGLYNLPGEWYASLVKPPFNPPNWIFGPVWTVLYIFIGIVGARAFLDNPSGLAFRVWCGQLVLNFLWSPLFFGQQMMKTALVVIVLMLISIVSLIVINSSRDRLSATLFYPYALWVSFATLLNISLIILN
jgi:tryptophan-rich sensory protein